MTTPSKLCVLVRSDAEGHLNGRVSVGVFLISVCRSEQLVLRSTKTQAETFVHVGTENCMNEDILPTSVR